MARRLAFFISIIAAIALCSCKLDSRVRGFEQFLLDRADSLAYSKCTEKELKNYLRCYHEWPKDFEIWIDDLKKNLKMTRSKLYDNCIVIKEIDKNNGKELPYEDVYNQIKSLPSAVGRNTSGNKEYELQGAILVLEDFTESLILWEEAQKWEQNSNHAAK